MRHRYRVEWSDWGECWMAVADDDPMLCRFGPTPSEAVGRLHTVLAGRQTRLAAGLDEPGRDSVGFRLLRAMAGPARTLGRWTGR